MRSNINDKSWTWQASVRPQEKKMLSNKNGNKYTNEYTEETIGLHLKDSGYCSSDKAGRPLISVFAVRSSAPSVLGQDTEY